MTLRDTANLYCDLLLLQYRTKSKARANIAIYVKQFLGDMLASELDKAFDVDTATGPQLDVIGKYVGVPRNIGVSLSPQPFFGFYDIAAAIKNQNGFQDSVSPAINSGAIFYQANFVGTSRVDLSDASYRLVLKLKIALNQNYSSLADIQQYLYDNLSGVFSLTDNADMTLTYNLLSPPPIDPQVLTSYLPRPMGVGATLVVPTSTAAPSTLTQVASTIFPPVNYIVTTSASTATPSPAGPALYFWERVSGDPIEIVSPFTPATQFRFTFNAWETRVATFRCRVTTLPGAFVSFTNNVIVTITAMI